ncbi:unnamed protein product [Merluccius merluccius]
MWQAHPAPLLSTHGWIQRRQRQLPRDPGVTSGKGTVIRLDIRHWLQRWDAVVIKQSHAKYGVFMSAVAGAVLAYNRADMMLLVQAVRLGNPEMYDRYTDQEMMAFLKPHQRLSGGEGGAGGAGKRCGEGEGARPGERQEEQDSVQEVAGAPEDGDRSGDDLSDVQPDTEEEMDEVGRDTGRMGDVGHDAWTAPHGDAVRGHGRGG